MFPKKIYLNYDGEEMWSGESASVTDCDFQTREYTDLNQVWHPASEEPQGDEWEVLCDADGCYLTTDPWTLAWKVGQSWEKYVRVNGVKRWLYVSDLLPSDNVPSTK